MSDLMPITDMPSLAMAIGEIRGQMREVAHGLVNTTQTLDRLTSAVAKLEVLPTSLAEVKADVAALEKRVDALEADEHKRKGAVSFWAWLLQTNAPVWLAALALGAWGFFKGKLG